MIISDQTRQFIADNKDKNPAEIALRASHDQNVDIPFALTQIAGRQMISNKVPSWYATDGILYPKHLSIEQCSSEPTALYKASLLKGESLLDLTGGMGIDCAFLARNFREVTYIEKQTELCELAQNNFPLLGLHHVKIQNENSIDFLERTNKVSCIFIDPARRSKSGGKTIAISDCEPDIISLKELLLEKAENVLVKLSPMLDISQAIFHLPQTKQVHIISADNECKEVLLLLTHKDIPHLIHCINLRKGNKPTESFVFTKEEETVANCRFTEKVQPYIYEPNASILKAGAYKSIAVAYNLSKLHPNSHLYTSDKLVRDFPGRVFNCHSVFSLNKKEVKTHLKDISEANITARNFPLTVAELRKRLKLKEGGTNYLFATTLANDKKVILHCTKIQESI